MNAPPEAPAEAPVPRRRPFIAVSGWLLLLCLFLPTLRVCGKPTLPIEFPPTYVGYLGAAVIAVFAVARRPRTRQLAFSVFALLWSLTLSTWFVVFVADQLPPLGLVLGMVLAVLHIWSAGRLVRTAWSERTLAVAIALHGLAATGWNTVLAFDKDGMWGAMVALAASVMMLVAGTHAAIQELREHARRRAGPPLLPAARAIPPTS